MVVIGHWNKFHHIQQVKLISIEQNVTAVLIEYSFHWQWWGIFSLLGFVQITQMQMIFFLCLDSKFITTRSDRLHSVFSLEPWLVQNSKFQLINTLVSYIVLTCPAHRNIWIEFKGNETSEFHVLPGTGRSKMSSLSYVRKDHTETDVLDLQHFELKSYCRLRQIRFTLSFFW